VHRRTPESEIRRHFHQFTNSGHECRLIQNEQVAIRLSAAVICAGLALAGCDDPPPAPDPQPSPGVEQINGSERIGWDQRAATAAELSTFRYLIYVDDTGTEPPDVSCAESAGANGFACSARLPAMTAGPHTLALSAFVDDGGRLESPRSAPLSVIVVSPAAGIAAAGQVTTLDGVRLRVEVAAGGLVDPTDLAFAPDGRLFIAERDGRILVFRDDRLLPVPAATLADVDAGRGGLLAIAVDPDYSRTRHLFAVYTAASGFRLARFRAVADTLGDRAIVLDAIESSPVAPAASLRFGPDAKLYLGVDDGGEAARAGDLGSFSGKVLRLNPDGSTPVDQAGGSPVYALDVNTPRGLDWDPGSHTLWVVAAGAPDRLQAVVLAAPDSRRGTTVARYALPAGTGPSGLAFYRGDRLPSFRGNLLVAADRGRAILRLQLDPTNPQTIVSTERLLRDALGGIRAIGVSPDGTLYLCTADALVRLVPD